MSQVAHFKCPHCGQMQGGNAPPNFTMIAAPGHRGPAVVVLSCRNLACQAVLGTSPFRPAEVEFRAA